MVGTAGLKNLEVTGIVGVYPRERERPQPVVFDIEVDYDLARAARSDALADAVDYDGIAAAVGELVRERRFALLETMAEAAAALLLDRIDRAQRVRLEVRKPRAVPAAACAFVRVERARS